MADNIAMDDSTQVTLDITKKTLELSSQQMEFVDQINDHVERFFSSIRGEATENEKPLKFIPKKFTKRLAL